MSRLTKIVAVVLAASAVTLLAPTSAHAAGSGWFTGNGVYSPGLTAVPTLQSGTMSGTTTGAFENTIGAVHCNVSFASTAPETIAAGQGIASASCTGTVTATGCSLTYTRMNYFMHFTGACTVAGSSRTLHLFAILTHAGPPGAPTGPFNVNLGYLLYFP